VVRFGKLRFSFRSLSDSFSKFLEVFIFRRSIMHPPVSESDDNDLAGFVGFLTGATVFPVITLLLNMLNGFIKLIWVPEFTLIVKFYCAKTVAFIFMQIGLIGLIGEQQARQ